MNIQTAIKIGSQILRDNNVKSAMLDSEILMSTVLQRDRNYTLLNEEKILSKQSLQVFNKLICQRLKGKPIAYLTGKKEFWKYEFQVKEGILIPRPDTEILVEEVLKITRNNSNLRILDIGVGSGCLLLSILKERKNFHGTGIDKSKICLDMSKINSFKLGLMNRVKFFKSDIDNFKCGKYDLIISNPPYINKFDLQYLEKDVRIFEPKLALNGGLDGISEIRKVINKSSELIKIKGKLILEIAYNQKEVVKKLLRNKNFYVNRVIKDLANNDRCIISTKI